MPCIDFREIPEAHVASGNQDSFELFARDFLTEILNFKILSEPSRGADGGKDILAEEIQFGTLSTNRTVWLISCKHKAHSGKSVTPDDEANISDRIEQFKADGFIGFYSTLPSGGLNTRLDSYRGRYKIQVFDRGKIESSILEHKRYDLFRRYFPESYAKWIEDERKRLPSKILASYEPLKCAVCGIDLLNPENDDHGIVGFVTDPTTHKCVHCYTACRGNCDEKMDAYYAARRQYTGWNDINDLLIPTIFLQKNMAIINQLHDGLLEFDDDGLEEYKQILIRISQYVFRHQTENDLSRIKQLSMLPEGI